jgi:hypothetical protein
MYREAKILLLYAGLCLQIIYISFEDGNIK